ncbi:Hpt domain-containing protein [Cuneatibacter sp. NSJ-177]|uniref:Hpt domain-containing protein n=1 Tax=Cuneatibacter sp. NSJ-177 TaxID=2931401 RepID=UPI001FD2A02B|nr:Hpt domain-containing protein [Cuneatibacter sp. NSJ-177]MCJ7835978.1 Hpt domain-containing protein [Cuneatibacter sp. NSJ-177]
MNDQAIQRLKDCGVDVDGTVRRLMNKVDLYERLLRRFPEDQSYDQLKNALEEGRVEDAFHAAHTLKGVSGNLGLNRLMEADSILVELLRKGVSDGADEAMEAVSGAYQETVEAIREL